MLFSYVLTQYNGSGKLKHLSGEKWETTLYFKYNNKLVKALEFQWAAGEGIDEQRAARVGLMVMSLP